MNKIQARARVQVTVEITVRDIWGGDCPISQLHKQASESALEQIQSILTKTEHNIRIMGEPQVFGVISETLT